MARDIIQFAHITPFGGSSEGASDTIVTNFRDVFRNKLNVNSWGVGDIVKWQGNGGNYKGYAFGIYARDGGENTGEGWLFICLGGASSQPSNVYLNNNNVGQDYVRLLDTDSSSYAPVTNLIFGYHPEAGLGSDWGFGYTHTDGQHPSLSNGDFTAPSSSPYTQAASFFSTQRFRPTGWYSSSTDTPFYYASDRATATFLFDDTYPFVAMYAAPRLNTNYPRWINVAGKIVDTYDNSDTDEHAFLSAGLHEDQKNSMGNWRHIRLQSSLLNGNTSEFNLVWDGTFGVGNSPLPNGEYPWKPIGIVNGSYYKGRFKPNVIRQVGWEYGQFGQIFETGEQAVIKLNQRAAVPWKNDVPSIYGGFINDEMIVV